MYTQFTDPIVFSIQFCSSAPPAIIMQRVHNNCTCPLRGFKNRKSKKRKKIMDMYQCNAMATKGISLLKKNLILSSVKSIRAMNEQYL
jgi:hypothetical protein